MLAHASSLDTDRTPNARAPTSTRSTGFCAIWVCIADYEFEFGNQYDIYINDVDHRRRRAF